MHTFILYITFIHTFILYITFIRNTHIFIPSLLLLFVAGWLPSTFCVRYINKSQVLDPKHLHINLANTGLLGRAEQWPENKKITLSVLHDFIISLWRLSIKTACCFSCSCYLDIHKTLVKDPAKKYSSGSRGRSLKVILLWRLDMKTTCRFSCSCYLDIL